MKICKESRTFGRELTNLPLPNRTKQHQTLKVEIRPRGCNYSASLQTGNPQFTHVILKPSDNVTVDPQEVTEYIRDIFFHTIRKELQIGVIGNYLHKIHGISLENRTQRVAWMIDVHRKFKLLPHTLYLAVWIFDKCMASGSFVSRMQELSIVALFISAKYEQTYRIPKLKDIMLASRCVHKEWALYEVESEVTRVMDFELVHQSSYRFLQVMCKYTDMSMKNFHLTQFIIELAMLDPTFLEYRCSLLSAAAYYLVSKVRKVLQPWPSKLSELFGYNEKELQHCARQLLVIYESANLDNSTGPIRKKFSLKEFSEVTTLKLERKKQ